MWKGAWVFGSSHADAVGFGVSVMSRGQRASSTAQHAGGVERRVVTTPAVQFRKADRVGPGVATPSIDLKQVGIRKRCADQGLAAG